jgi:hypothetical protein
MIPAAIMRALTAPALDPNAFTATKWSTSQDKAAFGGALLKFMANDFPRNGFKKALYTRLSMTFGHIAHNDVFGFFSTFFEDETGKIDFLEQTLQWPCWGDPAFTFCDVERVIQTRLRSSGLLDLKRAQLAAQARQRERAQFERLKAKYEPAALRRP